MNAQIFFSVPRRVIVVALAIGLSACGGSMDDLNEYIDEVKARPGQRPAPLPEIKPYQTFVYEADRNNARSPFQPAAKAVNTAAVGPRPDQNRPQEYLEQFPLDSLAMVGTLAIDGVTYGLLQDPDLIVHRVVPGNYLGQNDGRIKTISAAEIELQEIVADGLGGYLERDAAISLAD